MNGTNGKKAKSPREKLTFSIFIISTIKNGLCKMYIVHVQTYKALQMTIILIYGGRFGVRNAVYINI